MSEQFAPFGDLNVRTIMLRLAALIIFTLLAGQAFADNWNVVRLRGTVLQLVDGAWQPLERNDVVPDNRVVLTRFNGHATLTRGNEIIELAPNTQIQIYDQGGSKPFTTVVQHFGTVGIEAEVRNVQHFAVKNQYLAAVVKGTRFTVTANRFGGTVQVQRGHVEVDSSVDQSTTLITVGQKANVRKEGAMTVSGQGDLPPVVKKGSKAAIDAAKAAEKAAKDAAKAAEKAAKDQSKAAKDAAKAAEKAAKDAAKAAETAAKDQSKAAKDAAKDAEKAAKDAAKAAEKAAKDAEKAVRDAEKTASRNDHHDNSDMGSKGSNPGKGSNGDNSGKGGDSHSSGKGSSGDNSGKGGGDNSGRGNSGDHSGGGGGDNSGKGGGSDKPKKDNR